MISKLEVDIIFITHIQCNYFINPGGYFEVLNKDRQAAQLVIDAMVTIISSSQISRILLLRNSDCHNFTLMHI